MEADRDALLSCDVAGALPGGAQADDGTAWEIGHACAKGMPVTGLRTDLRFPERSLNSGYRFSLYSIEGLGMISHKNCEGSL